MESFFAPFSVTANTSTVPSSSSSNVSLVQAQQDMSHFQNVNLTDSSAPLGFPEPYFVPYDQNLRSPYMDQPLGYPLCSLPMEQSSAFFEMPNYEPQSLPQPREDDRKVKEAWMSRVARDRRKQARQRSKSSASGTSIVSEGTIREQHTITSGGSNLEVTVNQNTYPHVFNTPDGKRLEEILTKELKNSDVGCLGRIVLPKREAEAKLPVLLEKEGIDVVLKDVYSELYWTLRYKYWCNNKSRMYLLENTGEFVSHYQLKMGDCMIIYEDQFKNLYVLTKKEKNLEVSAPSSNMERLQTYGTYNYNYMHAPYTYQAKEEEDASLALLIKELNHKREVEAANSLLTAGNGGGSSSGTKYDKIAQDSFPNNTTEGASNQVSHQATNEAATSSSQDQQSTLDDVYGGLDNILEVGCNYLLFDHLTDYNSLS